MADDFKNLLNDAGLPVTEEKLKEAWQQEIEAAGFTVNNNSPVSPFWRVIEALVTKPVLWLFDVITSIVLPNMFVATAKDAWLDRLGEGRNVSRKTDIKAQGVLHFSRTDSTGSLTLTKGTIVQSQPINGRVYQLQLLYDVTFGDGVAEVISMAEAMEPGQAFNLAAGYYTELAEPNDGVGVNNADGWLVTPGADIESDDSYRLRIKDKFAHLGDYHVDAVYRNIIAQFPGISSDNIIFEYGAPRGAGSANAYAFLEVGQLSATLVSEINSHIASGYHGHGDDLQVFSIPVQGQTVTVDIWQTPQSADKSDSVEQFIRAAFRENDSYKVTRPRPVSTFAFSVLKAELHKQFPELTDIEFNLERIQAGLWMPVLDSLTVTRHD